LRELAEPDLAIYFYDESFIVTTLRVRVLDAASDFSIDRFDGLLDYGLVIYSLFYSIFTVLCAFKSLNFKGVLHAFGLTVFVINYFISVFDFLSY